MKNFDFWGFQADVDTQATQCWYSSAKEWNCSCGHCQNFLTLARKRLLPKPVLEALDALAIPPEKATYVCELYPDGDGFRYQFSYRIAGVIVTEPEQPQMMNWGCGHEIYPYGAPGFPQPHFDLEFWVTLPWIQT
ncbi:MAG: hypothetical protein IJO21_06955 [Oscillospiraceae bacterium]|nr:hypothetical protein [Oscillospiraceae bacterium]